jgi:hypothetical protein
LAGPPAGVRSGSVERRGAGDGAPASAGRGAAWVLRELAELAVVVLVGTGAAVAADQLVGRLDGTPPAYLLLILALPFWDLLPHRLPARVGIVALLVSVIAAAWLGIAMLRPEPWWRAEVAFGLACGLVGTAHVLLVAAARRRRTVVR